MKDRYWCAMKILISILIMIGACTFLMGETECAIPHEKPGVVEGLTPAKSDNLSHGIPGKCDKILEREGFAVGYSMKYKQPLWVAYRLTKAEVMTRKASRMDSFYDDVELPLGAATMADYRSSGYDKGHLAPAGDMHSSDKAMLESFSMANMSPQTPAFNRGVWSRLEQSVRRFAYVEGSVFVVTGPVFVDDEEIKEIGRNKVRVPEFFYKVIYDETPPEKMIGFILPNRGSKKPLDSFAVSVDDVEAATGLDFFNTLPQEMQTKLEAQSNSADWPWRDKRKGGR